ncbi:hypothetical protein BKA69DRAFT_1040037 [Paraphysoderma sedebokerense]|nr:hypothetical protein BKA69DRAFT_1040037 [Paraphysoderma sedebokerense]
MGSPIVNQCDLYATRLGQPEVELKLKCQIASELRENVDVLHSSEYPSCLTILMPVFKDLLLNLTKPVFASSSFEQKLRFTILEILHRFPQNDHLKPFANDIVSMLMTIIKNDNEDNAVLALKIIVDLHRVYKNLLEEHVEPFLDLVMEMYRRFETTVKEIFDQEPAEGTSSQDDTVSAASASNSISAPSPQPMSPVGQISSQSDTGSPSSTGGAAKTLAHSLSSFKVLTECPIIVVLLYQSFKPVVDQRMEELVSLVVKCLSTQPAAQREAHGVAEAKGDLFVGVASGIQNRAAYTELVVCQVKTLSFLAYMVRGGVEHCVKYQETIPTIIIRMLQDFPPESTTSRKELLVATRHIMSTEYRRHFVKCIDLMLNEKVLIGSGITTRETLRSLALSMLADLIHHIRNELSSNQLSKIVYEYTKNLHDPTLSGNIQTMCAKLLLNLLDSVVRIPDKVLARSILIRVLNAFTSRFESLSFNLPNVIKAYQKKRVILGEESNIGNLPDSVDEIDFEHTKPIPTSAIPPDADTTRLNESRFLIRQLIQGLKTIIIGLKSCNPPPPPNFPQANLTQYNSVARGFSQEEVAILIRLFKNALKCFDYFIIEILVKQSEQDLKDIVNPNHKSESSWPVTQKAQVDLVLSRMGPNHKEEKEILEHLAIPFINIDPAVFQEVFVSEMPFLFDSILVNTSILTIPQFFLGNEGASHKFSGILLRFLVDRLEHLGASNTAYSAVMLRLFKLVFMAVTLFPEANEVVLQPHVSTIITSCMKLSAKAKEPSNYFFLLRALFRSIGGGRFELLYKEVLPLLQVLLEGLNGLLASAQKPQMRELFVELCLTVPVRLSVLLPFLQHLMKPLVLALQAGPELVSQGLRTLELCIDNLTQEFLDPIMLPVIDDLMKALWKHLQPLPYNQNHAHATMRILGKLGGRNRKMLKDTPILGAKENPESGLNLILSFPGYAGTSELELDRIVEVALQVLEENPRLSTTPLPSNTVTVPPSLSSQSTPESGKLTYDVHYKKQALKLLKSCIPLLMDINPGKDEISLELARKLREFYPLDPSNVESSADGADSISAGVSKMELETTNGKSVSKSGSVPMDVDETADDRTEDEDDENAGNDTDNDAVQIDMEEDKDNNTGNRSSTNTSSGANPTILPAGKKRPSFKLKKEAQEKMTEKILFGMFLACINEELEDEAKALVEMLVKHFALLKVAESIQARRIQAAQGQGKQIPSLYFDQTRQNLSTNTFVDTLVSAMTSENPRLRKVAESALQQFYDNCIILMGGNQSYISQLPVFHAFASRFCACCYKEEWYRKSGGCLGISILSSELDLGKSWMLEHELDFVKSLLYILKDQSPELATGNVEDATRTLSHVLKVCNRPEDIGDESSDRHSKFNSLIGLLISELSNSNSVVRETIQSSFQLLADLTGSEVTELLMPVRERLLAPIFAKPLRALPFAMQIGHIDAITYCLSLRPPLLTFNDELVRLLHEALALADAEDQALVSKAAQYKNASSLINLRIVCIKLLSAAMACSDFMSPKQSTTRGRIISVFFKSLYNNSSEVVEVANKGLQQVLAQNHKLPKDLLQNGLRPVLMNLSDPKKLTVSGLEGLARLLGLLTSYFKVEIGKKLLDHLRQWATPEILEEVSGKALSESNEIKVVVAILDVFPLLPPAANMFMDDVVNTIIDLETRLRRTVSSPFRRPLLKYLNRYATDAVDYFLKKLGSYNHSRLLIGLLRMEESTVIRREIMNNPTKLISSTFNYSDVVSTPSTDNAEAEPATNDDKMSVDEKASVSETTSEVDANASVPILATKKDKVDVQFQGILIVREIIRHHPEWLLQAKQITECLIKIWKSPERFDRLKNEESADVFYLYESRYLAEILMAYVEHSPSEIELLFELASIFTEQTIVDFSFLGTFFYDKVALRYSNDRKREILVTFLNMFKFPSRPTPNSVSTKNQRLITQSIRLIIIPMLFVAIFKNQDWESIMDVEIVDLIHQNIWQPLLNDSFSDTLSDGVKIELLQLTSLIVRYSSQRITDAKKSKDVIKFAWSFLRLEDITGKQAAYCAIAQFISAYETPQKIIIQIYVALLKAHQPEVRFLVRKALDTLVPNLPLRLPPTSLQEMKFPVWARWTRKLLIEEGHVLSQQVNIFQLFVRHPDLFYDCREQFLPQIINSLPKMGLMPTSTPETKQLAVDLVELILKWEFKRIGVEWKPKDQDVNDAESSIHEDGRASPNKRPANIDDDGTPSKKIALASDTVYGRVPSSSITTASPLSPPNSDMFNPHAYTLPTHLRESTLSFLVRFACIVNEPVNKQGGMADRSIYLIKQFLSQNIWNDVAIKLGQFEKPLTQVAVTDETVPMISRAVQILDVEVCRHDLDWISANLSQLHRLIERCLRSENSTIISALQSLIVALFKAVDFADESNTPLEVENFKRDVYSVIQDGLQNLVNIQPAVVLADAVSRHKPENVDPFLPLLIKNLQKLIRDHTTVTVGAQATSSNPSAPPGNSQLGPPSTNTSSKTDTLLSSTLKLLKSRAGNLDDQRKVLLNGLAALIEKSNDLELCRTILEMVTDWVWAKDSSFPTIKEKATLLVKMMCFENKGDQTLVHDYLNLVAKIYNDPTFARSDLTSRLEQAFLMGARSKNPDIRNQFIAVFDRSIMRSLYARLNYILGIQNWEYLADSFWIHQALDIILGSIHRSKFPRHSKLGFRVASLVSMNDTLKSDFTWKSDNVTETENQAMDVSYSSDKSDEPVLTYIHEVRQFLKSLHTTKLSDLIEPIRQLQHLDVPVAYNLWVMLFPICWRMLSARERHDLTKVAIPLLAKDYHVKQVDSRPNVIQALLEGMARCNPPLRLSPHVVKYLGKTFNAWHIAADILHNASLDARSVYGSSKEDDKLKESILEGLTELLYDLSEDDMFQGLWRRRCQYAETNAAISYEQTGMYSHAMSLYESAQNKARTGTLSFQESEYCLWEDHWIMCAEKLQQWDILDELSRHDGNNELALECAWRMKEWNAKDRPALEQLLQSMSDPPGPRRKVCEAFLVLIRLQEEGQLEMKEKVTEFQKICDEGVQLSLRKWHSLPDIISTSHIPLLQLFQQFVELGEALQIYTSLSNGGAANLEVRSPELKGILQTWRERLPNMWDDINVWSDVVAWRQHIFSAINHAYHPIVSALTTNANANNNSFAYRGYHETAWIINRFAHVARVHSLTDVCINYLPKIYTLPNIEIQEAFLKLREQAKCYLDNPAEYSTGLDVINNTNLLYFGPPQKAEFIVLKGKFLSKLGRYEEANVAFSSAVQTEMGLAKAWAAWGDYHDQIFKSDPEDYNSGSSAVNCYLQAIGMYKNFRSRKFIARVLWLLSLDDANQTLSIAFETFAKQNELAIWYWITFIPQLLTSLSHNEARHARNILIRIAKSYPQALHFLLRTAREEYLFLKTQQDKAQTSRSSSSSDLSKVKQELNDGENPTSSSENVTSESQLLPTDVISSQGDDSSTSQPLDSSVAASNGDVAPPPSEQTGAESQQKESSVPPSDQSSASQQARRQPWEYVEEIMAILKTAYPLLALSMETMVDQIIQRLKPASDEDMYRLIVALHEDSVRQLVSRIVHNEDLTLPFNERSMQQLANQLSQAHPKYKHLFEEEFINSKPTLPEIVVKFREWRDRLQGILDNRPRCQNLENFSHYLVEFEHQKFDDVEVPGQYLLHKDNNADFIRIDRFQHEIELIRGFGSCYRRITIRGHDGSLHPFIIQSPAVRASRREERTLQLFRIFNNILDKRKESRKRNLQFHLPVIVPLAPTVRMIADDPSYTTLQDMYEDHCDRVGLHKDDPAVFYINKLKSVTELIDFKNDKSDIINLKVEIFEEIAAKMVPDTVLTKFMTKAVTTFTDLWMIRKQFTSQMAAVTFMTYVMGVGHRYPQKFNISRTTGNIWASDALPSVAHQTLLFQNMEAVPFRLTPNIQKFMTPTGVDGLFSSSVMAIARALSEPKSELDNYLSLFIRDELISWTSITQKPIIQEKALREKITQNVENVSRRADALACKMDYDKAVESLIPANQTVLDLISQATNPQKLAMMDVNWSPFL